MGLVESEIDMTQAAGRSMALVSYLGTPCRNLQIYPIFCQNLQIHPIFSTTAFVEKIVVTAPNVIGVEGTSQTISCIVTGQ